jgi:hypothetical protein
VHLVHPCEASRRQQECPVELAAVDAEEVDLIHRIRRTDVALGGEPRTADVHTDDISSLAERSPLDLNPPQLRSHIQREVGAPMLGYRLQNWDAQLRSRQDDRDLGDCAFAVAVVRGVRYGFQHERMFAYRPDGTATPAG